LVLGVDVRDAVAAAETPPALLPGVDEPEAPHAVVTSDPTTITRRARNGRRCGQDRDRIEPITTTHLNFGGLPRTSTTVTRGPRPRTSTHPHRASAPARAARQRSPNPSHTRDCDHGRAVRPQRDWTATKSFWYWVRYTHGVRLMCELILVPWSWPRAWV